MSKVEEMLNTIKLGNLMEEKKCNKLCKVLLTIGIIAAIAGVAYLIYRYFCPDDFDEFEDELDDDFDDDFFDDEEE
jgi:uncharacterized membrane protein YebE (DUF533 family)